MRKQSLGRKIFGWLGTGLLVVSSLWGGTPVEAASETWGPQDREMFTWESPAPYVTFNSITDNPSLGKEANFVRVREYGTTDKYSDEVDIEPGKEYEVYVYYHNNASANLNETGEGIAQNVHLKMESPEKITDGQSAVLKGTIYWGDSANPADWSSVWDTAYLTAHDTVYLRYVDDTAVIHNGGSANGAYLSTGGLFENYGVKLAHDLDYLGWGIIPGCNEFAGYVTFRLKADQPLFYITKEASKADANDWNDTITVKPDETVDFKIHYKNYGTTEQTSVRVFDKLPDGLTYAEGTTFVVSPEAPNGVYVADKIMNEGLVIGDFQPGQEATITYKAKVSDEAAFRDCLTVLYNKAEVATANGTEYDSVKITVDKGCDCTTHPEMEGCDNCVNNPDMEGCKSLPETGPGTIILIAIIVLGIGGGGFYWYKTRKDLQKVEKSVKGDDGETANDN